MDFIVDNYFWFIVGGIVVLMIIIGYIAEQTDFGRKPFGKKKNEADNKVVAEQNEETLEPVENLGSEEVIPTDFTIEDGVSNVELPEEIITEDNSESLEQVNVEEEPVVEDAIEESTGEDFITELDVPEIADEVAEEDSVSSDVVEDVITEDSEDDVWKF